MSTTPDSPAAALQRRFRLITRRAIKRLTILFLLIGIVLITCHRLMIAMPGVSYRGSLPPATDAQKSLAAALERDVRTLAPDAGSRSTFYPRKLADAAKWIDDQLAAAGYPARTEYPVERGSPTPSIEVELKGTTAPADIVVVGAHYDSFQGTPGADDNASGAAAVLALARTFATRPQPRTIRFVLFVNEEPPSFMTPTMGSWVYAKACRARGGGGGVGSGVGGGDSIVAMLSLETIGFYSDVVGSQKYPQPLGLLYPSRGDFIAFVGNVSNRTLVRRAIATFREHTKCPSEGAALPEALPGVGWSDHWAFWQEGYPAIMITDTAPFRNPNYHGPGDTPDTLDYDRMARVVEGIERVIIDLASAPK